MGEVSPHAVGRAVVILLWNTETVKLWYPSTVKNITVSVPDEVYRQARIRAAERGRSVSALVADYLCTLSDKDDELTQLEEERRRIIAGIEHFSASDRLDRDAVHERDIR